MYASAKDKAEVLSRQFSSVFTVDDQDHQLMGPGYPPINDLIINDAGIKKLLLSINPNNASGPDNIPCRML